MVPLSFCKNLFGKSIDYDVKLLFCSVAIVFGIRFLQTVWLFTILSQGGKFSTPWMDSNPNLIPNASNWLWLFNAWDSLQFQIIARAGYSHPNYVFLPAYPILIRLVSIFVGGGWFGAFLITQFFSFASLIVFQRVAEIYLQPKEAFFATILMGTFPYVSVFTSLNYSESFFLFSTLSAWCFYKKQKIGTASLFAALASVTRIYGVMIILPILLDVIRSKRYGRLLYVLIPGASVSLWIAYCYFSTGDPLASWTDEKFWTHGANGDGIRLIMAILFQGYRGFLSCCSGLDPVVFFSLSIFVYLLVKVWNVDRLLWGYAVCLFGLLILTSSSYVSLLRFLAFIFPVWLTLRVKNPVSVLVCVIFFALASSLLWLYAIAVTFVG